MRKFSDRLVEQDKLDLVLEAGRVTPTAYNSQSQGIPVLNTPEEMKPLTKCCPFRFHRTLALVVYYEEEVSQKREDYDSTDSGEVDMRIVDTHIIPQVSELRVGSTQVMHFDPQAVRRRFHIPKALVPMIILMIGYPREDAEPSRLHSNRFELSKAVLYHTFQG